MTILENELIRIGITILPDFILVNHIEAGGLQTTLDTYETSPLGIYAKLFSNRYIPQRVRVLLEFLQIGLALAVRL